MESKGYFVIVVVFMTCLMVVSPFCLAIEAVQNKIAERKQKVHVGFDERTQ